MTTSFRTDSSYTFTQGTYTINVGKGGLRGANENTVSANGIISQIKNNVGTTLFLAAVGGGGGSKFNNGASGVGGGGGAGHGSSYVGGSSTGSGGIGGNAASTLTGDGGVGGANVANKNGGNGSSTITRTGGVGGNTSISGTSVEWYICWIWWGWWRRDIFICNANNWNSRRGEWWNIKWYADQRNI